jgi:hypothetical protein
VHKIIVAAERQDPGQHVGEPRLRIDVGELGGLDQRVGGGRKAGVYPIETTTSSPGRSRRRHRWHSRRRIHH